MEDEGSGGVSSDRHSSCVLGHWVGLLGDDDVAWRGWVDLSEVLETDTR